VEQRVRVRRHIVAVGGVCRVGVVCCDESILDTVPFEKVEVWGPTLHATRPRPPLPAHPHIPSHSPTTTYTPM
jgi:hypothetical protein